MESLTSIRPTTDFSRARGDELPDTFPPGRRCLHEANGERCLTTLNRYHGGSWCYAHEGEHERLIARILEAA